MGRWMKNIGAVGRKNNNNNPEIRKKCSVFWNWLFPPHTDAFVYTWWSKTLPPPPGPKIGRPQQNWPYNEFRVLARVNILYWGWAIQKESQKSRKSKQFPCHNFSGWGNFFLILTYLRPFYVLNCQKFDIYLQFNL